jgi:hypothetical protein
MGSEVVDWIYLAKDRDWQLAFMNKIMNPCIP